MTKMIFTFLPRHMDFGLIRP